MSVSEEKRIYVVVAEEIIIQQYLKVGGSFTRYKDVEVQPPGRIAAQVAHAVSKMRWSECQLSKRLPVQFTPITTIVLSARNDWELRAIMILLGNKGIRFDCFHDANPEAYGEGEFLTALATEPITAFWSAGALDHLPLWGKE